MPLKVTVTPKRPGVMVISPIGAIDASTYTILDDKVAEALEEAPDVIIFDLEFTDYISSTGIRVLLKTRKTLKETDGKMVFMNLQPQIRKVFEILQAIPTLKVFASIQELDNYLDIMQKSVKKQT